MSFQTLPFLVVHGDRVWQLLLVLALSIPVVRYWRRSRRADDSGAGTVPPAATRLVVGMLLLIGMAMMFFTFSFAAGAALKLTWDHEAYKKAGPRPKVPWALRLAAALPYHRDDALYEVKTLAYGGEYSAYKARMRVELHLVDDDCEIAARSAMNGRYWDLTLRVLDGCPKAGWSQQMRLQVLIERGDFQEASALAQSARVKSAIDEPSDSRQDWSLEWHTAAMIHILADNLSETAKIVSSEAARSLKLFEGAEGDVALRDALLAKARDLHCLAIAAAILSGDASAPDAPQGDGDVCQLLAADLGQANTISATSSAISTNSSMREVEYLQLVPAFPEQEFADPERMLNLYWVHLIGSLGDLVTYSLVRFPDNIGLIERAYASGTGSPARRAFLGASLAFHEASLGRRASARKLALESMADSRSLLPLELQELIARLEVDGRLAEDELARVLVLAGEQYGAMQGLVFGHLLLALEDARGGATPEAKRHLAIASLLNTEHSFWNPDVRMNSEFLLREFSSEPGRAGFYSYEADLWKVLSHPTEYAHAGEHLREKLTAFWWSGHNLPDLTTTTLRGLAYARSIAEVGGDAAWHAELVEAIDKWRAALGNPKTAILITVLEDAYP